MDLRAFKEWIIENDFENNELFQESLVCYCNRAYKAAYMFSYLAFIEYLRDIILEYKGVPIKFEEKWREKFEKKNDGKGDAERKKIIGDEWNKIRNDLTNEDDWDKALKNIINEADYNIFCYDTKVRSEFEVKKNHRNVCAHNKERIISNATVEDLWDFIAYVKPLSVINGTAKYIIKMLEDIIQFCNRDEYKEKAHEIYRFYMKIMGVEKKEVFVEICKKINLYYPDEGNTFFIELFELIFHNTYAEEYQWVEGWEDIELFMKINVCNYKREIDKVRFYKYLKKRDIQWSRFDLYAPTAIFMHGHNFELKKRFLLEMFNNEKHYTNWNNLLLASDDWEEYIFDDKILSIIKKPENIKIVLSEIKKLYTYDNGYNKNKETSTFDYSNFSIDNKITRKIMLILILAMKNNIDATNVDVAELIKRCKLVISYADKDSNYSYMSNNFRINSEVYSWLLVQKMA